MQTRNCLSAEMNLTQVIYKQKLMEKYQKESVNFAFRFHPKAVSGSWNRQIHVLDPA